MKPLELVIYPHVIDCGVDCIEDDEGTLRIGRELDDFAGSKRLTEAELSAEYWAAHGDANALMIGNPRLRFSRRHTLRRFATLPHYDEPNA